ncbi:MAG: alpha/beta fold hydrolase [Gammaproteobacteria bacterium]|nr:alpha/beta fold hydrolase [Gammaproteobacteria bacterium]
MPLDNYQVIELPSQADQLTLFIHQWTTPNATGWVHIMHGMGEHGLRYAHLAKALNDSGFNVSADDHRGHGLTGKRASSIGHLASHDGWNKMVSDQAYIIEHLHQQWAVPLTILGHSMGSFLAMRVVQRYSKRLKNQLQGLVLSGSNYSPPWLFRMASVIASVERWRQGPLAQSKLLDRLSFGSFNNAFRPIRTPKDWVNSDPIAVDAYMADPLAGHGISNQFWFDFLHGLADLSEPEEMASIDPNLPIYLFSGDKDPVGKQGRGVVALQKAFQRAGSKQVNCRLYPNGRHEMINEVNKQQVIEDLLAWLENK